jgi:hypothetical protein
MSTPRALRSRDAQTISLFVVMVFVASGCGGWIGVIDHLNPRFLNFKRKIDKETSVIFCAVGTEFSSFIHLL